MASQDLSGYTLGNYRLIKLLGEGGMGSVYLAQQLTLGREVAVKVLPSSLSRRPDFVMRFRREAETVAKLDAHPNIVSILDFATTADGISYVVMRLLTGGSLSDRLRGGEHYALEHVSELLYRLAGALDFAHKQGIIHRDIKPDNIMFDEFDTPYIVDFGIAKIVTGEVTTLTQQGAAVGTPAYMAPEQWKAKPVEPATDQYSLAIVVYYLLTHQLPFMAETPQGLMYLHIEEAPPPPSTHRRDIPNAVSDVLLRALAKDPRQRYPTVTAFAQAFDQAVRAGSKRMSQSQPIRTRPERQRGRFPVASISLIVLLAIAGLVLGFALFSGRGDGEDSKNAAEISNTPSVTTEGQAVAQEPSATPDPPTATHTLTPSPSDSPTDQPTDTPSPTPTTEEPSQTPPPPTTEAPPPTTEEPLPVVQASEPPASATPEPPTATPTLTPTLTLTPYPESLQVISPSNGAVLVGTIAVFGSASHPDFSSYQIDYGPYPNPSNLWYPIGSRNLDPVFGMEVLGVWDTSTVSDGYYVLRVMVNLVDGSSLEPLLITDLRVDNVPDPTATPTQVPPSATPTLALTQVPTSADPCIYLVQAGDTLFVIAEVLGVTVDDLMTANPTMNPDFIEIGQQLTNPACANNDGTTLPATPAPVDLFSTPTVTPVVVAMDTVPADLSAVASAWVHVTGGEFMMGTTSEEAAQAVTECVERDGGNCAVDFTADSLPAHAVVVDDFLMEQTEVSTAQYVAFLNYLLAQTSANNVHRVGCAGQVCTSIVTELETSSIDFVDGAYRLVDPDRANLPMTLVTWYGAQAYCEAIGGRLPTEAEWERAARGPDNTLYPWGATWDAGRANAQQSIGGFVAVNAYPNGASADGLLNMAGNVAEWTADWYDADYYTQQSAQGTAINPAGPVVGVDKVARGGAWDSLPFFARSVHRVNYAPTLPYYSIGFRCVRPMVDDTPSTVRLTDGVELVEISNAGDLDNEFIVIRNNGAETLTLDGWILSDGDGDLRYTLPDIRLFSSAAIQVYSRAGQNTPVALYANATAAVWQDGDTATLSSPAGDSITLAVVVSGATPEPAPAVELPTDPLELAVFGVTRNDDWEPYIQLFGTSTQMALVPAGCFTMGNSTEGPAHLQCFDEPYWIDVVEISTSIYQRCVDSGACTAAVWFDPPTTSGNTPVLYLKWFQAEAFCEWRGSRLVSEREWEYAARGPDGLLFPWGNDYDTLNAVHGGNSSTTVVVGSETADVSWVGVKHLLGNVAEWTISKQRGYPYDPTDGRENTADDGTVRVVRGGSYALPESEASIFSRRGSPANNTHNDVGFRCMRSFDMSSVSGIERRTDDLGGGETSAVLPTETPTPEATEAATEVVAEVTVAPTAAPTEEPTSATPVPTAVAEVVLPTDPLELAVFGVTSNDDWTPYTQLFGSSTQMALVPAGCYTMGTDADIPSGGSNSAAPAHRQCFDEPFWIDVVEVSNAIYQRCVDNGACPEIGQDTANNPRQGIKWFQAEAFCEWRGSRLPSEREWEYAVRGPDSLLYPWGNTYVSENSVHGGNAANPIFVDSETADVSWVGATHLYGNVSEWMISKAYPYPYDPTDGREITVDDGSQRVMRGGTYALSERETYTTHRRSAPPGITDEVGFRCVRSFDMSSVSGVERRTDDLGGDTTSATPTSDTPSVIFRTAEPAATEEPSDGTPAPTAVAEVVLPTDPLELAVFGVTSNDDWTPYTQLFGTSTQMALVPAGCFTMGSTGGQPDASPTHVQCFDEPFWIDVFEVTFGAYDRCVAAGVCGEPWARPSWASSTMPAIHTSWIQSQAFCNWRSAHLPTEREWEYAARGPSNLRYTWGNSPDTDSVTHAQNAIVPLVGGSKANDLSWVGVYDLMGNVAELTLSKYLPYPYDPTDGREDVVDDGTWRVMRGGGFAQDSVFVNTTRRNSQYATISTEYGFRCVRSFDMSSVSGVERRTDDLPLTETSSTDTLLNINTATLDELIALPAIGETTAQRIIDYRTEFGPFQSIDDLTNVVGIGLAIVEELRPYVTVE